VFKEKYSETLIKEAASITKGFPYLFQLLGYYLWDTHTQGDSEKFVLEAASIKSKVELFQNVHWLVFDDLSQKDKEFIFKMNLLNDETDIADMLTRLDKGKGYISLYRQRLISAGVIKSLGYGKIGFTLPYTGEFLESKSMELGLDII
jgi:hypothetical protein